MLTWVKHIDMECSVIHSGRSLHKEDFRLRLEDVIKGLFTVFHVEDTRGNNL